MANQDRVRQWFFSPDTISREQHMRWSKYEPRDDDFVFVVEETERFKRPVGQVSVYRVDWSEGRAEVGRLLLGDTEALGLGLAGAATDRLVREALTAWRLREVYLNCRESNVGAVATYVACGFRKTSHEAGVIPMARYRLVIRKGIPPKPKWAEIRSAGVVTRGLQASPESRTSKVARPGIYGRSQEASSPLNIYDDEALQLDKAFCGAQNRCAFGTEHHSSSAFKRSWATVVGISADGCFAV